jgi:hypothetical protein
MSEMKYKKIGPLTKDDAKQIIAWNDIERLRTVPLSLSLYSDDLHWAIGQCINLASHNDVIVRGNAILSFGHFARRFHFAHRKFVEPLIQSALKDKNKFIRGQAENAADDIDRFCTWKVDRDHKKKR